MTISKQQPKTIPLEPTKPCHICGNTIYWLRREFGKPTWVCQRCHPEPNKDEKD